jgi:hypothetical protein
MVGAVSHPLRRDSEPVAFDAVPVDFEELELPFEWAVDDGPAPVAPPIEPSPEPAELAVEVPVCRIARDPLGTFPCCPLCGGELRPEHAHYRCACGWRDSCCD